jgi:neutral trehalase
MEDMSEKLVTEYVFANYKAYEQHCEQQMFEKLTVTGDPGKGGEYEVQVNEQIYIFFKFFRYNFQTGFGWTNGVILDLLTTYDITWTEEKLPECKPIKKSWSFHKHLKTMG